MRIHDSFTDNEISLEEEEQKKKRLFNRGVKLSWALFFLTFVFFVSWIIGHPRERLLVSNTNFFSEVFFFLNPHLFRKVFLEGHGLVWLQGAVSMGAFVFLLCYIVSLISFALIIACATWLFVISYYTSIKPFHYISCLSVFPIIGWLLINWFIFKLAVYQFQRKRKKTSKFDDDFLPEEFESDEALEELSPDKLATRPITVPFGKRNYDLYFKKGTRDYLQEFYDKLTSYIS
ncbi:hypothetical protein MHSWG343_02560 [Candidatus Mycoplasma haematohominis]|uniref:Uncharacterized protein n=1 Tax=Candidatus Mycoplasma haematohominis TaxID=1494318 RepID=A0A478FS38_9MOLU|nr:hypothetical protein MHSWG343_02560 [Candidatus Mycoplasma haemohominis]